MGQKELLGLRIMLTVKEKQEIANELIGSCTSTWEIADQYLKDNPFDGDLEVEQAANEYGVFLCVCGWWCEEDEMNFDKHDARCEECVQNEQ